MPGYKGHIAGAAIAWMAALFLTLFVRYVTGLQALEWGAAALAGGLFPDLDIKSVGQKWLFRILFIISITLVCCQHYKFVAFMLLCSCVPLLVKHRGLMHSLSFITCLSLAAGLALGWRFPSYREVILFDVLFFWLGALSHLVLDGHGVFAPYKKNIGKKFKHFH